MVNKILNKSIIMYHRIPQKKKKKERPGGAKKKRPESIEVNIYLK